MLNEHQRALVERYLDADPVQVALKTGDRAVAEQVATLRKARVKLPRYFAARCHILPISYEQCTSQRIAFTRRLAGGKLAVDLTCGLGVDTLALAERYDRVITVEIDPVKAEIAKLNMALLSASNVEVVCASAEQFLATFEGHADLIFCDPSRRTVAGRKVHALTDCTPNIIELMPQWQTKSDNLIIKLSPLFDVEELFTLFGENIEVETISEDSECKEVVLKIGPAAAHQGKLSCTILRNHDTMNCEFDHGVDSQGELSLSEVNYIHIPDVSFLKSRTVGRYMRTFYTEVPYLFDGYLFTATPLENFTGRSFTVAHIEEYKPKLLKKLLAEHQIQGATIYKRSFPRSTTEICRALGLREGGDTHLFFTTVNHRLVVLF